MSFQSYTTAATASFSLLLAVSSAQIPLKETAPLTGPRLMHGAAVLGDYLYVVGGNSPQYNGWTNSVERAQIYPDGSLGNFVTDRPMPQIRSYISTSTVALNDVLYVIGGTEGDNPNGVEVKYQTALINRPNPDGSLSEWVESDPFPGPGISCFTVSTSPGFLHIIGGRTDAGEITSNVITGLVGREGDILQWEPAPPLPVPLWFHHSATANSRVWVYGGLTGQTSESAVGWVFSAPIMANGRLGQWRQEATEIPVGIYRGSNAVAGPYLMAFCVSYSGNTVSSDVVFSGVYGDSIMPWQRISTPLPMTKFTACATDYRRGRIYIPGGGFGSSEATARVGYFELTESARREAIGATQTASADITPSLSKGSANSNRLTYQTQDALPQNALEGFLPYEQGRRKLFDTGMPMLVYFHLDRARPAQQQADALRNDPEFQSLTNRAIFTWVDVVESPQVAQSLGVFRSPTWILYDNQGIEKGRAEKALTAAELRAGLEAMQ